MNSQSQSFTDKMSELTNRLHEKDAQAREFSSKISNLEAKLRDEIAQKEAFESRVNEIKTELLDLKEEALIYKSSFLNRNSLKEVIESRKMLKRKRMKQRFNKES